MNNINIITAVSLIAGSLIVSYGYTVLSTPQGAEKLVAAKKSGKTVTKKDIPGPVGYPIFGVLPYMFPYIKSKRTDLFFSDMHEKFGKMYTMPFGDVDAIVVEDPVLAKKVLNTPENFQRNDTLLTKAQDFMPYALFFLPDGRDIWKKHRKGLQPAFGPVHLREACTVSIEVTDHLMDIWEESMVNNTTTRNVMHDFTMLTGDVIGRIAFSFRLGAVESLRSNGPVEFHENMEKITNALQLRIGFAKFQFLWGLLGISPAQTRESVDFIKSLVHKTISEKKAALKTRANDPETDKWTRDLLDRLLDGNIEFSEEEIVSEVFGFFLAGHETTANTLTWSMVQISQRPDVLKRLRDEISQTLGSEKPTMENLNSLRYLDAFIKEIQRVHSVVHMLGKVCHSDCVITSEDGLKISVSKGTGVFLAVQRLQKSEKYWGEDAKKFNPDRWLVKNADGSDFTPVAGSYLPFGDGQTNCIGQKLALIEAKVVLIRILQKFTIRPSEKQVAAIEPVCTLTVGLKNGLYVDCIRENI
ncbi:hypothetical protein HK098_007608 [Nowakowskiella sp. JEL0407]|nr:hypothetical protein HK098_007608 [Nowakowskiella sp. JEL0407]